MPAITHFRKLSLFTALSLADLALTWFLLEQPGGGAYEWNPIAAWLLARFGWCGLALFKLGIVLLSGTLTLVVSQHRPRAAGWMITFGCAVLVCVVSYSSLLVPDVLAASNRVGQQEVPSQRLERKCADYRSYNDLLDKGAGDLACRRCSLVEALDQLAATEKVRDREWQRRMAARFPGYQGSELLAALLIEEAILSADADRDGLEELYSRLDAQFQLFFHRASPRPSVLRENGDSSDRGPGSDTEVFRM